jgi:hypothetical protein
MSPQVRSSPARRVAAGLGSLQRFIRWSKNHGRNFHDLSFAASACLGLMSTLLSSLTMTEGTSIRADAPPASQASPMSSDTLPSGRAVHPTGSDAAGRTVLAAQTLPRRPRTECSKAAGPAYGKQILVTVSRALTADYGADSATPESPRDPVRAVVPDEAIVVTLSQQLSWLLDGRRAPAACGPPNLHGRQPITGYAHASPSARACCNTSSMAESC